MTQSVKPILSLIAAILLAALASNSKAANVNPKSFEQQVAEADLVVLAKVSTVPVARHRFDNTGLMQITRMNALRILKGNKNIRTFDFVTRDEIAELDPGCCKIGKTYILLLRRGSNQNIFAAVNGHYSVIPVQ